MRKLAVGALLFSASAHGFYVERLNDEKDKIIVTLSDQELTRISISQRVKVLILQPYLRLDGAITKITSEKHTAVVTLDAPELTLVPRVHGRFQPLFSDRLIPRVLPARSQWYQNTQSSVDSSVGGIVEYTVEDIAGIKSKSYLSGTRVGVAGQVVFSPEVFGMGLAYDESRLRGRIRVGSKEKVGFNAKVHQFEPGAWYQVEPRWKAGLAIKYTTFDHLYSGYLFDQHYELNQYIGSMTYTDGVSEWTWAYESKDEAKVSPKERSEGISQDSTLYKAPAIFTMEFRKSLAANLTWGVGGGYIFYERSQGKGVALRQRATHDEKVLLHAMLTRIGEDGTKWDWTVSYAGARDNYQSMRELGANMGKLRVNYQMPSKDAWVYGGACDIWGGKSQFEDQSLNTSTKETETSLRSVIGAQFSVEGYVSYQADLLNGSQRRSLR